MTIADTKDLARAYRQGPYAWPGGYPTYIILSDGEYLCWECLKSEYGQVAQATREHGNNGWRAVVMDINWEDTDATCGHCCKELESAYSDDN